MSTGYEGKQESATIAATCGSQVIGRHMRVVTPDHHHQCCRPKQPRDYPQMQLVKRRQGTQGV